MKPLTPEQKMIIAEKEVKKLHDNGELKQLSDQEREKSIDERHAKDALTTAQEFIGRIRELMIKR